ncbi:MerR family transcriptional regulator [Cohnella endophytica]|uniref:MerR family transcriptional regulator n=1 Tax=Cohnella endophytica TaxID=2419778 RepID=A0A494Y4U0_9BACL|nr:MerR family transcriptional regulator [Cohnella endophytica]RKP55316.1 MerR family transcriptional regulator [Cohnella endophytica]
MLSIGEVAEKSGTATSALRYYEEIGLIPPPARQSGRRVYSEDILGRLDTIKLAQSAGFQIQEIKQLLDGFDSNVPPSERWKVMARKKQEELESKINQMTKMRTILAKSLDCDCLSWEECFADNIKKD